MAIGPELWIALDGGGGQVRDRTAIFLSPQETAEEEVPRTGEDRAVLQDRPANPPLGAAHELAAPAGNLPLRGAREAGGLGSLRGRTAALSRLLAVKVDRGAESPQSCHQGPSDLAVRRPGRSPETAASFAADHAVGQLLPVKDGAPPGEPGHHVDAGAAHPRQIELALRVLVVPQGNGRRIPSVEPQHRRAAAGANGLEQYLVGLHVEVAPRSPGIDKAPGFLPGSQGSSPLSCPSLKRASLAAICCASFLLLPLPNPTSSPVTETATLKTLS